ncbi:hypothetical protein WA026_016594 [Henosepilachna vigintioctopunctata]|uniref:Uncharacterized protein n=1 Tax=Henosepilachna vigintioctopunctata TaxID=420089 RepID=A0AAW1VGH8_9CUCU
MEIQSEILDSGKEDEVIIEDRQQYQSTRLEPVNKISLQQQTLSEVGTIPKFHIMIIDNRIIEMSNKIERSKETVKNSNCEEESARSKNIAQGMKY